MAENGIPTKGLAMDMWQAVGGGICCGVIGLVVGIAAIHLMIIKAAWDSWK